MPTIISIGIQALLSFRYMGSTGLNRMAIITKAMTQKPIPFSNSVITTATTPIVTTNLKRL